LVAPGDVGANRFAGKRTEIARTKEVASAPVPRLSTGGRPGDKLFGRGTRLGEYANASRVSDRQNPSTE